MPNENNKPPGPPSTGGKPSLDKLTQMMGKSPTTRLLAGVGSGWVTGMITVRLGRVPVVLLGSGIVLFQAAQNQGLIKQSWKDVSAKATNVTEGNRGIMENTKQFARNNPEFAAGFTGGFLIGLAC